MQGPTYLLDPDYTTKLLMELQVRDNRNEGHPMYLSTTYLDSV